MNMENKTANKEQIEAIHQSSLYIKKKNRKRRILRRKLEEGFGRGPFAAHMGMLIIPSPNIISSPPVQADVL
jgi:hypothetical protein